MFNLFLDKITRLINKVFVHNSRYKIGKYKIVIPSFSDLPKTQKKHPLYDRFLPVLASHLPQGTIIDVGANIGDTLVAMAQNCSNSFICVEPLDIFFNYLKKNADILHAKKNDNQQVTLIKEMVGCGYLSGELQRDDSRSAHLEIKSYQGLQSNHKKLDNIIDKHSDIVLIKSDVDGYDFDVIRSAEKILTESNPVLFFENAITDDFQYEQYSKLYDFLKEKGYSNLYIFDNFGYILIEKSDFKTLRDLNTYQYNMPYKQRTIFYTDILVSTEEKKANIEAAIADYKNNYIKKDDNSAS